MFGSVFQSLSIILDATHDDCQSHAQSGGGLHYFGRTHISAEAGRSGQCVVRFCWHVIHFSLISVSDRVLRTVIGGGTAGLAIASRLAVSASVAVVEAGGLYEQDNGNQSVVPYYGLVMPVLGTSEDYPRQPLIDWDLLSTVQPSSNNRRIHYVQGKTLGGSSAINTMAYHRGTVGAYRRWADLVDDQSYVFDKVLPYFKRTSALTPPNPLKRNSPNATVKYDPSVFDNSLRGPLQVSWGNWVDPTQTWLSLALQAIGQALNPNGLSSGKVNGGAWVPTTINPRDATRSTSKSSYLDSHPDQQPIVYLRSQASKVLFDKNKKATGVLLSTNGQIYVLSAKKEVILSAGVFHSPQLLMLSGMLCIEIW